MTAYAILMIEDDHANIRGTIALLENEGLRVDIAKTVNEARRLLQTTEYDVLLVDWTLPVDDDGPSESGAGGRILESLNSGELGDINQDVPHFIITKQTDQFGGRPVESAKRLGVLSKLDALRIVQNVVRVVTQRTQGA